MRTAKFVAEPVIKTGKSGEVITGLGWCVKVMWDDGLIERRYGFASQQAADTWIADRPALAPVEGNVFGQ